MPSLRSWTSVTSDSCGGVPRMPASCSRVPVRSKGPSRSSANHGIRRTSASHRLSVWAAPTSPRRRVRSTASRRSGGPARTYMSASSVLSSAHWRSSTTTTTGRSRQVSSSHWSSTSGGLRDEPRPVRGSPSVGGARSEGSRRRAARRGTRGTVVELSGRQAPVMSTTSGVASAQARPMRRVLPTPASPETSSAAIRPDRARSTTDRTWSSSWVRPTNTEPADDSADVATVEVWHCARWSSSPDVRV